MTRLLPLVALCACTGSGMASVDVTLSAAPSSTARSADGGLDALVVDVGSISANGDGGWSVVAEDVGDVDLVALDSEVGTRVASGELPQGEYSELRLEVLGATATVDGVDVPVTVPSGDASGLKLKGDFCLDGDAELGLVWDVAGSLRTDGASLSLDPQVHLGALPSCGAGDAADSGDSGDSSD